ncbi:MAG: peptidoglycan bridge formation glycyltransferase FemA/FemB family protein [Desulfotignum sp.]|nr:peptidoglycan bridge formation glycyltransferase FemA/FemB family protein [Desulfotignum sp.]
MHLLVKPKKVRHLLPTDIIFQTQYWAQVKARLGWQPRAYDIEDRISKNDMLVLVKSLNDGACAAYVPQGPEFGPHRESYGPYLESLSESIVDQMDSDVAFIRYDLPWESPYTEIFDKKPAHEFPDERIRELRMNFGTKNWNFRKTPVDMTVADSYVIDIDGTEDTILGRMKSKTRYNIRLAARKGVRVYAACTKALPVFHELHLETAKRKGFLVREYSYFETLFSSQKEKSDPCEIKLMLAVHGRDVLAGAIVAITEKTAYFLYGASAVNKRNFMSSYALHWETIRYAKALNCRTYDMGAVSPAHLTEHPFFGLYRFKTGFGGRIVHRAGSWDYPIDQDAYSSFRNWEEMNRGWG